MTREQYIVASLEQSYKSLKDACSALAGCSSDQAMKNLREEIEALENKVQAEYEKRYNELIIENMTTDKKAILSTICDKFATFDPILHWMEWRGNSVFIPEISSVIPNCNAIEFNGYKEAKRIYLKFINFHTDCTSTGLLERSVVTTFDKLSKEQKEIVGKFLDSLKPVDNEQCAGFYWQTMRTGK